MSFCLVLQTGKSKGYAYIEFAHKDVAKLVADTMNNYLMFTRILKCKYSMVISNGMYYASTLYFCDTLRFLLKVEIAIFFIAMDVTECVYSGKNPKIDEKCYLLKAFNIFTKCCHEKCKDRHIKQITNFRTEYQNSTATVTIMKKPRKVGNLIFKTGKRRDFF